MAMWLFIIADSATFAGCLVAYGFIRNATPDWPRPFPQHHQRRDHDLHPADQQLDHAHRSAVGREGRQSRAFRWMMITAVLGILFAVLHIREWLGMIGEGATLFHNPWGTPLFSSLFFSITGLHLLHVTGGVVALIAVGFATRAAATTPMTSKSPDSTGTSWIWCGCSWCR
jgi:cytochrome c oxidase subunit III